MKSTEYIEFRAHEFTPDLLMADPFMQLWNIHMVFVLGELLFHVYSVRFLESWKEKEWKSPTLKLEQHEFLQNITGAGDTIVNGKRMEAGEGFLTYLPKGTKRQLISPAGKSAKVFAIYFDVGVNDMENLNLDNFDSSGELALFTHFRKNPSVRSYPLKMAQRIELERIIGSMHDELKAKRTGYQILVQSYVLHYIGTLVRYLVEHAESLSEQEKRNAFHMLVADMAQNHIRRRYQSPVTVREVAEVCCVSSNYLCTIFKRETGYTINQYLQMTRIEKSCEMIKQGDSNLTEIAHRIGYCDSPHFIRNFQKFRGMSPSQYLKTL